MKRLIYLLEDNEMIAAILQKSIELNKRFEVVKFEFAESLLEEFEIRKPDLILTDYYLESFIGTGNNGVHVLKQVKEIDDTIPIVLLSGMRNDKLEVIKKTYPFDAVISKGEDDFLRLINLMIAKFLKD